MYGIFNKKPEVFPPISGENKFAGYFWHGFIQRGYIYMIRPAIAYYREGDR